MEKIFVSSSKSGSNSKFRKLLGGKNKTRNVTSDNRTEYFPLSGGDDNDHFEFNPDYMSYEPQEFMADDLSYIPEEPGPLKRNLLKLVDKGSKYEMFHRNSVDSADPLPEDSQPLYQSSVPAALDPLYHLRGNPTPPPAPPAPKQATPSIRETREATPAANEGRNEWPTIVDFLCDLDLRHLRYYIRWAAQKSVLLAPLDNLVEKCGDIPLLADGIVGLELFIIMLISDRIAWATRIVCAPFVFVVSFITKSFTTGI